MVHKNETKKNIVRAFHIELYDVNYTINNNNGIKNKNDIKKMIFFLPELGMI